MPFTVHVDAATVDVQSAVALRLRASEFEPVSQRVRIADAVLGDVHADVDVKGLFVCSSHNCMHIASSHFLINNVTTDPPDNRVDVGARIRVGSGALRRRARAIAAPDHGRWRHRRAVPRCVL